jgi:hypothetical protein
MPSICGQEERVGTETTLAGLLRYQSEACGRNGSRLYEGLLARAATNVDAHGPVWEVLRGHESDSGPSALALRLMGAVNRLALNGSEPHLAAIYADPDPDDKEAFAEFSAALSRNREKLRESIERPVQTNEVGRCAALLSGFLRVASDTGLPLRLLEVGASSGLNLRWDRYRYVAGGFSWGPADSQVRIEFELSGEASAPGDIDVAGRRGCDPSPIDLSTSEGRETAFAYIWPDQTERLGRLRAALEVAAALPVEVDPEGVGNWIERMLAKPTPGLATVVYHSLVAQYFDEQERLAFQRNLEEAAAHASADAPLAWLRMEPAGDWTNPRAKSARRGTDVRLSTWPGGDELHLARAGYHGSPVELL